MQTLTVQPGVWQNDLNMIKMLNVTKQYSWGGGKLNVWISYPIFQTVWSMLVRHMQYCTFAMWMAMQSHQPLYCVWNIFSLRAGWLVGWLVDWLVGWLVGWFPTIANPLLCASSCSTWNSDMFENGYSSKNKRKAHFAFICENASCTVKQVLMRSIVKYNNL